MRTALQAALAGCAAVCLSGCAAFLVGAGAAGGYAISKDSISNRFETSQDHLYRVSRDVIAGLGLVTAEDDRGRITATVEGATVTVRVAQVSERHAQLTVKARRYLLPRISVAHTVYSRIAERLR